MAKKAKEIELPVEAAESESPKQEAEVILKQAEPNRMIEWMKKHLPFLFNIRSLFYFVCFIFLLGLCWTAYSVFTNHFTQLYGWDYEHQYVTFYYDYYDVWHDFFKTGTFRLYDYQTFLGTDNIGSNSYYGLFDPFVVLMILFPRSWIPQMTLVMTFAKLAVCALGMRSYLKYMGISEWVARLGAIVCAFSGYMNFFVGFPSFVSAIAYMPMFLLGIEKVLKEQKPTILIFAIALEGITSFFHVVPMCIFGVMYALWRYFVTFKTRKGKQQIITILMGIACFALGLMMSSWVLLPSIRESSLSGRTVSIGRAYLDSIISALKEKDFASVFGYLFEKVGDNDGRELMALISFFYPTGGYLYLPIAVTVVGQNYYYDAWTSSIFIYTPFVILFFTSILNSIRKKKWHHLVAIAICLYFLFTTFAYYFFFAFSGNGYGRWFFVFIPPLIYYCASTLDERKSLPRGYLIAGSLLSIAGTFLTYFLTIWLLKGKHFDNPNNLSYYPSSFVTAFEETANLWGSNGTSTWSAIFQEPRSWYIFYQCSLVVVESLVMILGQKKKWLPIPLFAFVCVEIIVAGNASFAYGSSYGLQYFNGGVESINTYTQLSENIEKADQGFYRSYYDMPANASKNYAMAVGYNGTSSFHSLMNFEDAPFARMMHISTSGETRVSYGEEMYNPSWSGYYGNKRFGTDSILGIKYYVIQKDGYGEFQGYNVPFGCEEVKELSTDTYAVFKNNDVPTLGRAVGRDNLYYIQASKTYPYSEYDNAFYDSQWGIGGSYEVMRNEKLLMEGAIIDDDVTLDGFHIQTGVPTYSNSSLFSSVRNIASQTQTRYYNTSAEDGDLYLDYDIVDGQYYQGKYYSYGPGYIFVDPEYKNSYVKYAANRSITIQKDSGHLVFASTRNNGIDGDDGYFNDDPSGAYFTLYTSDENDLRVYAIGDTFDEEGNRIGVNQLLAFEYHAISNSSESRGYRNNFGLYCKGRVKYIVFESNGPAYENGQANYISVSTSNFRLFMQERHEAYSTYVGDSIEAESQYCQDEYLLHDVVMKNANTFTFTTNYKQKQIVATQIAYDEGWSVKADGVQCQSFRINGGFVGFVAPGYEDGRTITYTMSYETPYLKTGLAMASVSFLIYCSYMLYDFIRTDRAIRKEEKLSGISR